MIKKAIFILAFILVILTAWFMWWPITGFQNDHVFIYIKTGKTGKDEVLKTLTKDQAIRDLRTFECAGNLTRLWPLIQPGKYKIKKGYSLFRVLQLFKKNQQVTINLVINKLRVPQQFASLIGKKLECDSVSFLAYLNDPHLPDKYGTSAENILSIIHPNTYAYYWSASPEVILKKIHAYHLAFWNDERKNKAKDLGLTPLQVTTLASIVDEETRAKEEKSIIARVYLNRLKKDIPLEADPTVKFATGDFTLRRILIKHIQETARSPYNTYKNKGLPPGPICTPQDATIDAVLNPDQNEYIFFCAAPGFTGRHNFAKTYAEHLINARKYHQWLNEQGIR